MKYTKTECLDFDSLWNSIILQDNFFFAFSGFWGGNLDGIKTVFIKGKELKAEEKIFFQKSCLSLLIYLISGDLWKLRCIFSWRLPRRKKSQKGRELSLQILPFPWNYVFKVRKIKLLPQKKREVTFLLEQAYFWQVFLVSSSSFRRSRGGFLSACWGGGRGSLDLHYWYVCSTKEGFRPLPSLIDMH